MEQGLHFRIRGFSSHQRICSRSRTELTIVVLNGETVILYGELSRMNRVFVTVGLLVLFLGGSALPSDLLDLSPNPTLTPQQVVEFQLDALRHNDEPATDAGIERSFRFASPSNRLVTGPLTHFSEIVHSAGYSALLGSQSSEVRGVMAQGNEARVYVTVVSANGSQWNFLFVLSRQTEGDYRDCWMTDSVMRLQSDNKSNRDQIAI
jgi:hypothetical protein